MTHRYSVHVVDGLYQIHDERSGKPVLFPWDLTDPTPLLDQAEGYARKLNEMCEAVAPPAARAA